MLAVYRFQRHTWVSNHSFLKIDTNQSQSVSDLPEPAGPVSCQIVSAQPCSIKTLIFSITALLANAESCG